MSQDEMNTTGVMMPRALAILTFDPSYLHFKGDPRVLEATALLQKHIGTKS
ncbi:hypothetical protein QO002_006133 [Pararhizobium capsulatum DSM 1112]|uniref:Uncharacterized protein n=1 Tax=Pararhizobium capsulatum DSM 1112 TaxID=1121113 RepID=A0ABU0C084_9HYPH|nr:hypothetical protein [Pararhizobium capsulatum DSM 1112]